jgi:tRNA-specific 2-thiouridylase
VAGKDLAHNRLVVVRGHDHPLLRLRCLDAADAHWIAGAAPALPARLAAKTRYRMADASCEVSLHAVERGAGEALRIRFDAPQWAPTPGQYVVVYDGDVCLGGAVIEQACGTPPHTVARAPAETVDLH